MQYMGAQWAFVHGVRKLEYWRVDACRRCRPKHRHQHRETLPRPGTTEGPLRTTLHPKP